MMVRKLHVITIYYIHLLYTFHKYTERFGWLSTLPHFLICWVFNFWFLQEFLNARKDRCFSSSFFVVLHGNFSVQWWYITNNDVISFFFLNMRTRVIFFTGKELFFKKHWCIEIWTSSFNWVIRYTIYTRHPWKKCVTSKDTS